MDINIHSVSLAQCIEYTVVKALKQFYSDWKYIKMTN